jgi:hypothetical protein
MAVDTLLTFWPPAPWARMALKSMSDSDKKMVSVMGIMARILRDNALVVSEFELRPTFSLFFREKGWPQGV